MVMKYRYATQDQVPEALREHYTEVEGEWLLQTDTGLEDATGLKTALQTERKLRRDAEAKSTELQEKFKGIDPETYQDYKVKVEALKDKQIYDSEGLDALKDKWIADEKRTMQRQLSAKEAELASEKAARADLEKRWHRDRIRTVLIDTASKSGCHKASIDDIIRAGLEVFTRVNDDGIPEAVDSQGDVVYGKDGTKAKTVDEWLADQKPAKQSVWWPGPSGSGAPPNHGGNGAGIDWSKLPPTERLTRWREQQAAGTTR